MITVLKRYASFDEGTRS